MFRYLISRDRGGWVVFDLKTQATVSGPYRKRVIAERAAEKLISEEKEAE